MVFVFGGFEMGRAVFLRESDRSKGKRLFKVIGAILVIAGFGLQLYGNLR